MGIVRILVPKADRYIVSFLCSSNRQEPETVRAFTSFLKERITPYCRFFIASGPSVQGMDQAAFRIKAP